jgi:hypothetical protein
MSTESPSPPGSAADIQDIREQLGRVLASPHFRNSKRYPALLRYVVEQALEGKTRDLKERTIGVEVFGRSLDYDPASDPVVRISAAEVRKRLAQYYQKADSESIRMELPVGSYVPEFRQVAPQPPPAIAEVRLPAHGSRPRSVRFAAMVAAGVLISLAVAWAEFRRPSGVEQFWTPAVASGGEILVCVGGSNQSPTPRGPREVAWPDALTLAQVTGFLEARNLIVRPCWQEEATFNDFQATPAVLIGGLNNAWTLRLMENLRFQFSGDEGNYWIKDRDHPESRAWSVPRPQMLND